jgi:ketosteroid isomerase-like protein
MARKLIMFVVALTGVGLLLGLLPAASAGPTPGDGYGAEPASAPCGSHPEAAFERALTNMTAALTAIRQGDAEPYAATFSEADDVTLFGAWGPIERGHEQLADTYRWVASRFGPEGETIQDITTVHRSGDLAVTVGFERGPARVDGGPIIEMVIRVTHVYRCEGHEWKLVHRHADFPPVDPRQAQT